MLNFTKWALKVKFQVSGALKDSYLLSNYAYYSYNISNF